MSASGTPMNLFQLGDFTLNSGAPSKWKLECDALTGEDVSALAEMIRQMVGPFGSVEGVPRGGLRLATALQPFTGLDGPHLIVDDVLTTGNSVETLRNERIEGRGYENVGQRKIIGAVVFARGQCPGWIKALFQMPECFWLKPRTR